FLAAGRRLGAILVSNPTVMSWRSQAALAARSLGRHEEAQSLVDEELALAERYGAPYAIAVARTAAGLLARGDEARAQLREAAGILGAAGAPIAQARALVHLGSAIRRG